MILETRNFAKV
jgi:hypothetical protein